MGTPTQTDPAATEAEGKFVQSLRNRRTRSLSTAEREQIAAIVEDKPKIDLEINFDYNSDRVSAKSLPSVQALGRALANPELKGSTFIVAGHTDAAGSDTYNQDLSERRADSIKHYLVEKSGIPAADLLTVGYGKSKLKDPPTHSRRSTDACRSSTRKTRLPPRSDLTFHPDRECRA